MNSLLTVIGFALLVLLIGCERQSQPNDLLGTWTAEDGAELRLTKDGTFIAHAFPIRAFVSPDGKTTSIDGVGHWKLVEGIPYQEVKLYFTVASGQPARIGSEVLVSDNGRFSYLYQWKDEEGGDQYQFKRIIEDRR